jgi:hypothetical protein
MALGNRILLVAGALVALGLAVAILAMPTQFYAGYGVTVGKDAALLNELKAPAGAILLTGMVMLGTLVRPAWLGAALLAGSLLYLGFGLGRLLAMAADGVPPLSLLAAMAVELVLGLGFAVALWRQLRG